MYLPEWDIVKTLVRQVRQYCTSRHHLTRNQNRPPSSYVMVPSWMPHPPYDTEDANIVWSLPQPRISGSFNEMRVSIQEDFSGIRMRHHGTGQNPIERLDQILKNLDRGLKYLN